MDLTGFPNGGVHIVRGIKSVEDVERAALRQAKLDGCTCEPDIHIMGAGANEQGVPLFAPLIQHDDWCPLLKAVQGE